MKRLKLNGFDNEVIGGSRGADPELEVDLPQGWDVEVGDQEDLLLLVKRGREIVSKFLLCGRKLPDDGSRAGRARGSPGS